MIRSTQAFLFENILEQNSVV